jgi:hypothetical protein
MMERDEFQKYLYTFPRCVRCYKGLGRTNLDVDAVSVGRLEATHDILPTSRGQKERGIAELSTWIDCSCVWTKMVSDR